MTLRLILTKMNKSINFEIDELTSCWRWKVPPPEPIFYYLSRVFSQPRISPSKKKISPQQNNFFWPRISLSKKKRSLHSKIFFLSQEFLPAKKRSLHSKIFFLAKDFSQQKEKISPQQKKSRNGDEDIGSLQNIYLMVIDK